MKKKIIHLQKKIIMQPFSHLSIIRGLGYLLLLTLLVNCKKDFNANSSQSTKSLLQPNSSPSISSHSMATGLVLSQTKTSNLFNWNGNPYVNLWEQEGHQYVAADDNSYAYSKKLSSAHGSLWLTLQDFRFEIPSGATIDNITVSVRRFKKGKGSIRDYFATLVKSGSGFYNPSPYGVRWTDSRNYLVTETEITYSQTGSNSGSGDTTMYEWTPQLINDPAFGVRIDTYEAVGGSLVVYYDQVTITVTYT